MNKIRKLGLSRICFIFFAILFFACTDEWQPFIHRWAIVCRKFFFLPWTVRDKKKVKWLNATIVRVFSEAYTVLILLTILLYYSSSGLLLIRLLCGPKPFPPYSISVSKVLMSIRQCCCLLTIKSFSCHSFNEDIDIDLSIGMLLQKAQIPIQFTMCQWTRTTTTKTITTIHFTEFTYILIFHFFPFSHYSHRLYQYTLELLLITYNL